MATKKIFKPGYTRDTTIFGFAISAVIAIPLALIILMFRDGPLFFLGIMVAILVVVVGLMLYLTLSGSRMNYELGETRLIVHFGVGNTSVYYTSIEDAQISNLTLVLRLFGGSWPGFHWGLFRASDIGNVSVYSTRMRGKFVLLRLTDGRKIALSPEDPVGFLEELVTHRDFFGKMEQEPKLPTTSRKVIYLQVFIVVFVYLCLLGYFFSIYPSLPEIIPVHFDVNWNPNRWAHKSELFILVGIAGIFPILNTIFALKFGKYGKALTIFLTVVFVLTTLLFFGVLSMIMSMV